ncbi:hypothetical protein AQJ11_15380 [Streptomyces corchorusii]|uniref:S-adenosyl methyltransferase n=1 Tax=Streptomyces corchorusii TaxID=1903 RepID=A0A101QDJ3_STRCK|nr:hypothetical protein AQJ11_15380 [Streptomyces corchorusii]
MAGQSRVFPIGPRARTGRWHRGLGAWVGGGGIHALAEARGTILTDPATAPASAAHPPHPARVRNHWLGGTDTCPVDARAGDAYAAVFPGIAAIARGSRAVLRRTITHRVREAGVRQFLDVGTGLPTAGNTHEVAQRLAPESRIVYVGDDPMLPAPARTLLRSSPRARPACVDADATDPDRVLAATAKTLDPARPTGLVPGDVLGHVAGHDQARSIVDRLMAALPPGSHLCVDAGSSGIDPAFEQAQ